MQRNESRGSAMWWLTAFLAFLLVPCGTAVGQCGANEIEKLTASDGALDDLFGCDVAISGNAAVVGAWRNDDNGNEAGSAYVYRFDGTTWVEEQLLLASDGNGGEYYGWSVAIDGDVIVVGAFRESAVKGAVYVYRYDGAGSWVEEAKLMASDGDNNDAFGTAVAVQDDVMVVGAYRDDDQGDSAGAAYVFRHDGTDWIEWQKLTASDGDADDEFGDAVAIDDDLIVVGARVDEDLGTYAGSAYVYRLVGKAWVEEAKLLPSDGGDYDSFGWAVSVDDDRVLVGGRGNGAWGAAYLFDQSTGSWSQKQKLVPGSATGYFGSDVAIQGSKIAIGAWGDGTNGSTAGAAFVFQHDGRGFVEEMKLLASDGAVDDRLGLDVAMDGNWVIAGAYHADTPASDAGAAYIFPGVRELQLSATPTQLPPGSILRMSTYFGLPGNLVGLAVIDVSGKPYFFFHRFGTFAADQQWDLTYFIGPGLSKLNVTMMSFGFGLCGGVEASNPVTLNFL